MPAQILVRLGHGTLILGLLASAGSSGCGGGKGGGGAPTHWKDNLGNDNFMPSLGESDLVTLDFSGKAALVNAVVYSPTDPDLILATTQSTQGIYAGRLSTGKLERYCGSLAALPLSHEPNTGFFTLTGDTLVFYAPSISTALGVPRYVCSHNAILSQDSPAGAPLLTQNLSRTAVPDSDGFWDLFTPYGGLVPTQIVHLKYDGTVDLVAPPAGSQHAAEPTGGAYYFLDGTQITKFDVHSQATSVVATGLAPGGMLGPVFPQGLVVTGAPTQFVVFARGTTPVNAASAAAPGAPGSFFEAGGAGIVISGARYDTTTGAQTQVSLANATPAMTYVQAFTPTGHVYLLAGNLHLVSVASKPSAPGTVTLDPVNPDYKLTPYPQESASSNGTLSFSSYADGNCLIQTGNGQGGSWDDGGPGSTSADGVGPNHTLSLTRCGSTSGKTIMVGTAEIGQSSDLVAALDHPYFTALHIRQRAMRCDDCPVNAYEQPEYQALESGWTVSASGDVEPLYQLAGGAWVRPHTLDKFVVRHDDTLVVVAGRAP